MTAPTPSDIPTPKPGEAWAYRYHAADPLTQVVIKRVGTRRPIRLLVRFVDPSGEGLEDWVPPSRLKAPWADVEAYQARERRWAALDAAGPGEDEHELWAAEHVFQLLIPTELATLCYHADGATTVHDVNGLSAKLGISAADLADDL